MANSKQKNGVLLFDFNETLSARRLLDDKRVAIDERVYRGKELGASRHSDAKREDAEMIRSMLKTDRKQQQIREPQQAVKALDKQQRAPNVVARLMGLDTLPMAPVVGKQQQQQQQAQPPPQTQQQQLKKKPEKLNPLLRKQQQTTMGRPQEKGTGLSQSRHPGSAREQLELEEMKRQLAVKQTLVREKLSEAKRLLSHEKLSGKRWQSANEKLSQSKQFLDAVDFFHSNKELLGYLDEQESVLHRRPKAPPSRAPPPQGLGNPIVRRVIEERRDEELRQYLSRQSEVKKTNRDRSPGPQVPTRIVVLKPSPNRKGALISPRTSTSERPVGSIVSPRKSTDLSRDFVEPKVVDVPKVEAAVSPREIAKEIARQVRENVVRELSRNTEMTADKRAMFCSDNSEDDDYGESDESHGRGRREKGSRFSSRATLDQVEDWSSKPFQSTQKRPVRNSGGPRQASGKSPPPPAKGIVVLVPDLSGSSRSRTPEAPFRDRFRQATKKDRRAAGHQARADEVPRNQAQIEFTQDSAHSKSEEIVDSIDSNEKILGYGGSFLLRSTPKEFQLEKDESQMKTVETGYASNFKTLDTGYVTDFASSSKSEEFAPLSSSSDSLQGEPSSRTDLGGDNEQVLTSGSGHVSTGSCETEVRSVPQAEQEDIKECPASTDQEETSLTSENSGQPSPVSVLESSFEDSPPHVSFETINSGLEELRRNLRLLKWDPQNDQEPPDRGDEGEEPDTVRVVDKVVVEDHSRRLQQAEEQAEQQEHLDKNQESLDMVEADIFEWLEWESFQIGDLHCPEGRKEDQFYVKNILLAAGLISKSQHKQQQGSWSLDPLLFDKLEEYYSKKSKPTEATRLRRRLLFKVVAEILETRYRSRTWWQQASSLQPTGNLLLGEVWAKLCDFYDYPAGEDLQHTVENLIEKYLSKGDRWFNLNEHVASIGLEIEAQILDNLLEETVCFCLRGVR